ncbi:hypothetical protein E3A20_13380 [Planctomyces bekefii]|uniref:Uncharacterized protein n=1 Tax=Planctomyces bekefii TaxID=1653850 RepID=A0A5C6M6A6_9PLAN|nr:hypothetical protein E3A20_13380 [Planctomyces bekefii]
MTAVIYGDIVGQLGRRGYHHFPLTEAAKSRVSKETLLPELDGESPIEIDNTKLCLLHAAMNCSVIQSLRKIGVVPEHLADSARRTQEVLDFAKELGVFNPQFEDIGKLTQGPPPRKIDGYGEHVAKALVEHVEKGGYAILRIQNANFREVSHLHSWPGAKWTAEGFAKEPVAADRYYGDSSYSLVVVGVFETKIGKMFITLDPKNSGISLMRYDGITGRPVNEPDGPNGVPPLGKIVHNYALLFD